MGAGRRSSSVVTAAVMAVAVLGLVGCGSEVAGAPTVGAGPASSVTTAAPSAAGSVPPGSTSGAITVPSSGVPSASTPGAAPTPGSSGPGSAPTGSAPTGGSSSPVAPSSSAEPSWKLPNPPGGEKYNEFNDVVAEPGVSYGLEKTVNGTKSRAVVFRVTKIQVDKGCDAKATPVNGHFVVLTMEVELRNETPEQAQDDNLEFTGSNWTSYDPDGTAETGTHSDGALTCGGSKAIRPVDEFDAGKVNVGIVVLDVSSTKGTTVFTTAGLSDGWEYTYG